MPLAGGNPNTALLYNNTPSDATRRRKQAASSEPTFYHTTNGQITEPAAQQSPRSTIAAARPSDIRSPTTTGIAHDHGESPQHKPRGPFYHKSYHKQLHEACVTQPLQQCLQQPSA